LIGPKLRPPSLGLWDEASGAGAVETGAAAGEFVGTVCSWLQAEKAIAGRIENTVVASLLEEGNERGNKFLVIEFSLSDIRQDSRQQVSRLDRPAAARRKATCP
jgi:hypothetical protein